MSVPLELDARWQASAAERALMAAVLGDSEGAETAVGQLLTLGGTNALFNSVVGWATIVVNAVPGERPSDAAQRDLVLEVAPVAGAEDVDREVLGTVTALFSAVANGDMPGARLFWETLSVESAIDVTGLVLGIAVSTYRPRLATEATGG